jgi:Tfp pilus assembly PilM family ATPase
MIGLDIGQFSVKVVRAVKRGGRAVITLAREFPISGGQVTSVIPALKALSERYQLKGEACAVSVCGPALMIQSLRVEAGDRRVPAAIAGEQIAAFAEMAKVELLSAFSPRRLDASRRVLLAMARRQKVEEALEFPATMEWDPVLCLPAPLAAFRAATEYAAPPLKTGIVVDLGCNETRLVMVVQGRIAAIVRFEQGGALFTRALADTFHVSDDRAEDTKRHETVRGSAPDLAGQALTKTAMQWVKSLEAAIVAAGDIVPSQAPVWFMGGGAMLDGLPEYMQSNLCRPVKRVRFAAEPGVACDDRFATAVGLAVEALAPGKQSLNLLPPELAETWQLRSVQGRWAVAAALSVALAGVSAAAAFWQSRDVRLRERTLRTQIAQLREARQAADESREMLAQLSQQSRPVSRALQSERQLDLFLSVLAACKAPDDWISVVADAASYGREMSLPVRNTADTPAVSERVREVIVEGYTPKADFSTVRDMIDALRKQPMIAEADLLGVDQIRPDVKSDEHARHLGGHLFALLIRMREVTP